MQVRFTRDSTRLGTAGHVLDARVWDVPSGEPVTEPLRHSTEVKMPEFSSDGCFLKVQNEKHIYVWAVPPPLPEGMAPSDWLLELGTLCASLAVNEAGHLIPALEAAANVEHLRYQITALPANTPLADWARWVLDERPSRPIAPGFTVTEAEAKRLSAARASEQATP
jgi:hypothetical protein